MTLTEALQAALSIEQQVTYGYGVVGAHLSGKAETYALACLQEHMQRRDDLLSLISGAHSSPSAAPPAYQLPFPVTDAAAARRLAARLEEASAGAAWDLIAAAGSGTGVRRAAVGWLTDAATRGEYWGSELALPGQPD
jgi:hypothetical protein